MEIFTPNVEFANMDFWLKDDLGVTELSDLYEDMEDCNLQGVILDFRAVTNRKGFFMTIFIKDTSFSLNLSDIKHPQFEIQLYAIDSSNFPKIMAPGNAIYLHDVTIKVNKETKKLFGIKKISKQSGYVLMSDNKLFIQNYYMTKNPHFSVIKKNFSVLYSLYYNFCDVKK